MKQHIFCGMVALLAVAGWSCGESPTSPREELEAGDIGAVLDAAARDGSRASTAEDIAALLIRLERVIRSLVPAAQENAELEAAVRLARRYVWNARNVLKKADLRTANRFAQAGITATRKAYNLSKGQAPPAPTRTVPSQ